jgi:lysophospholipase L1-like esterase
MYSYLALGDSYTIGEGVARANNFPHQTWTILETSGLLFHPPRIIAQTGWTTGELLEALAAVSLSPPYDFVSLLIGVNNEFRGQSAERYEKEFLELLLQSILLAGDHTGHTFVLSIPDWSVTPFAHSYLPDSIGRTKQNIAAEIDAFNKIAQRIAHKHHVDFIDITEHTRLSALKSAHPDWLAPDLLHPSGGEYRFWAEQLASRFSKCC